MSKSRIQKYGKTVIILLCVIFLVTATLCSMPWMTDEKVKAIWTAFGALVTGIGSIMGLTIIRYGARETALSLKGGYRKDVVTKVQMYQGVFDEK